MDLDRAKACSGGSDGSSKPLPCLPQSLINPYHHIYMPSFQDSVFLFVLALLLFGPKKLPMLARELGKWVGEFRRASNEFKMQMDEEIRQIEQADRLKKIEAMEAAAPKTPALEAAATPETLNEDGRPSPPPVEPVVDDVPAAAEAEKADGVLPIASSGELKIMPPSTGLPMPQSRGSQQDEERDAVSGLIDSIPAATEDASAGQETIHSPEAPASANNVPETAANVR